MTRTTRFTCTNRSSTPDGPIDASRARRVASSRFARLARALLAGLALAVTWVSVSTAGEAFPTEMVLLDLSSDPIPVSFESFALRDDGTIVIERQSDKSTPKLCESILTGTVHDRVELGLSIAPVEESGEQVYLAIELENARITSIQHSSSGNEVAMEELTLSAERIELYDFDGRLLSARDLRDEQ